jgi:chromosome segregation ATPase
MGWRSSLRRRGSRRDDGGRGNAREAVKDGDADEADANLADADDDGRAVTTTMTTSDRDDRVARVETVTTTTRRVERAHRQGCDVDDDDADVSNADASTTTTFATRELERELARERRARDHERETMRDELSTVEEALARSRIENERLRAENDELSARCADARAEGRARAESLERVLEDVCRTVTKFTTECATYGLVEKDVAATVEANPKIWIEPDGAKRERVGDLLDAVLDAHASTCAEYETKLAYVKAQPPSSEDVEEYERQMRAEVERFLGHVEMEMLNNGDANTPSRGGKRLVRTPEATTSANRGANAAASPREIEAERRELQDMLAEVQTQMRRLEEKSGAIETELRDQLETSKKESSETRDELERVLRERNLVVSELEVELKGLEEAQRVAGEETADAVRRAREDVEQERRRCSLSLRTKDAEIDELKERAENFRREIEELSNERKSLAEALGKARQAKEKLEEQLAGSEARIEGLLQEIDAMDAASAQASMHVSNAMASASEAHRRSLQEMRGKQAEAEAYIESLDARLEALEEEKDALRRELERAYARERETRARLQETEKRSNELTSEINALLEQDARRHSVQIETDLLAPVARTPPKAARSPRSNAFATTSARKLEVREVSDDESDGEEFVVVRRRATTAPNSPYFAAVSPRGARQLNGLSSVSSALSRARAELHEARAKRDRGVRRLDEF